MSGYSSIRQAGLCRDDYKPHRVEENIRSGKWTLAPNVKRHGFVAILQGGEKIGLVMCISCQTVCSRNSFRKIRTHDCRGLSSSAPKINQDILSALKSNRMLNHRALMSRKVFAPESTSSSLFPPSNIEVLRQVTDSNEPTTSSFNNSIPKTTKKEIATEPLEVVLSKMAANIQQTIAEKQLDVDQDHSPTSQSEHRAPRFSMLNNKLQSIMSHKKQPNKSSDPSPSNGASTSSDGEIIGSMVNSTYRNLASQNKRLSIEFKCSIMHVISEYEMMMLSNSEE